MSVVVRFYDRTCYGQGFWRQLGLRLMNVWSPRFVHVDVQVGQRIAVADMRLGVTWVLADAWPKPSAALRLDLPELLVRREFARHIGERYGWLNFFLVPFRALVRGNGKGWICSELSAVVIANSAWEMNALPAFGQWVRTRGAHTLTPWTLYEALLKIGVSEGKVHVV